MRLEDKIRQMEREDLSRDLETTFNIPITMGALIRKQFVAAVTEYIITNQLNVELTETYHGWLSSRYLLHGTTTVAIAQTFMKQLRAIEQQLTKG